MKDLKHCSKCGHPKPERCHHCSQCQACVLKMDHHCPWLGTCVGFANHKFFILFLAYAEYTCIVAGTLSAWLALSEYYQTHTFGIGSIVSLAQIFISLLFGFSAGSMLCCHIPLALTNQTTLESDYFSCFSTSKTRRDNPYDLGNWSNLKSMFGSNPFTALLPIFTTEGDGIHWAHNGEYQQIIDPPDEENMDSETSNVNIS